MIPCEKHEHASSHRSADRQLRVVKQDSPSSQRCSRDASGSSMCMCCHRICDQPESHADTGPRCQDAGYWQSRTKLAYLDCPAKPALVRHKETKGGDRFGGEQDP
ncbi:uncharacterized protein MYCGRDRAFT_105802 [Zymoseptoria tritici IPO323]|uniref:Uncharacterized protein n=1 Tax=Zymoseptoria tritici (strain CBS 115943 / IPO323) TaxID=336722 RepID=F9XKC9_ZYMTI|nr:uncharacterized protein MYCGRDRAFT_105802 [Zymoseptoria tritici IPO323]EGP84561.1 hypothetical protein MYCGRDRAFT_105802 [Zymoseptoria tritici IPO323]